MGKFYYKKKYWQKRRQDESQSDAENNNSTIINSDYHQNQQRRGNNDHNGKLLKSSESESNVAKFEKANDDYSCVLDATNFVLAKGLDPSEYSIEYADYEFEEQYTTSYLKSLSNKNEDNSRADNNKSNGKLSPSPTTKENFNCINQQVSTHPFANFYEYSYYVSINSHNSHMKKEEFKHIYHLLRYIVSSTRAYELHLEWDLEDEDKFRKPKFSIISKLDSNILISFLMVFPKQDSDGKHFPDILPKFIPLFNISTSLFLLSTQFIHTLNHLFVEQFKKTINILSFRPGYILDAARVIEQMIKIWEIHLIRKAQNDYNSISDNYMEMFDHQFQSRIQGVAGGDFSIIPASNVGEAFQSLPTTKLPFELLVSFLYEESWQHCSLSFTQQTIEEFELKNIMKSSSLKNNDNIAFTLGLNITDVLDNSKRSASPDIQHCYGKHPASPNKPAELIWIITFRRIYDKLRMVTSSFNFHHHGVNSNKLVTWIFDSPLLELLEQYLIQITFNQEDDETNVTGVVSLIVSIVLEIELLASKESRLPCEQWPKVQYMENVFMMFKIHWLDNGKFLEMIEDDIDDSRKVSIRRNTRGSSVSSPVPTSPHCYFVSKKEMFLLLETESAIWSNVLLNADMYQISTSTYDQGYVGNLDDEDEILTISTLDADNYQLV